MGESNTNNLLAILAIVIVAIAVINVAVVLVKVSDFREKITGYATSNVTYGFVNITITQAIVINASRSTINFGSGGISGGFQYATMFTNGNFSNFTDSLGNGTWPGVANDGQGNLMAIIIENVGNLNCSLTAVSNKNATTLFDSISGSNQDFQWNFSNLDTGACITWNNSALYDGNNFADVNVTGAAGTICNNLGFVGGSRPYRLTMDILVTVPNDAQNINDQSAIITLTGNAVIS